MSRSSMPTGWLSLFGRPRTVTRSDERKRQRYGLKVESLESRQMMSATPIQFNIPPDVLSQGVYAAFSGQLTADYVDKAGATIPNGAFVYYNNTLADYAVVADGQPFTFQLTGSGQQVELPNTPVKGGEIDIGVGSPPVVINTGNGLSTPTPATSPTSMFGLVEYSYTTDLDLDMSEIDQVGFPFWISSTPDANAPAEDGVGLKLNRGEFFDRYTPFIASQGATAAAFEQLYTEGLPYRLLAPQDILSDQQSPVLNPTVPTFGGGLTANTTYNYWVTGTNAYGETTPSNVQQVVTSPKSINGHNVSRRTVPLDWTQISGATGYNIYRSQSSDPSTALLIHGSTTNSFTDTGYGYGTQTMPTNDYTFNPLASYFNADLDSFFTYYETHSFNLDRDGHTFVGHVDTNYLYEGHNYTVLVLTSDLPDLLVFKPYFQENTDMPDAPPAPSWMVDASDSPGEMIFGASGSFADGVEQYPSNAVLAGIQKDLENDIDAAFNRGIATNYAILPNDWADDPTLFYQPGTASNWYAGFLHTDITTNPTTGVSINGLAYGFAYDDNGGSSTNFQGTFSLVNINLMPWGDSPVPPGAPASIVFLNQPVNGRLGSHENVAFQVLGANGQPYTGGTTVVGNLEGAEDGAYTMITDPLTGIGHMRFENTIAGVSHIQLSLAAGPTGGSGVTAESDNFIVSSSGPSPRWPRCGLGRGTSSHSMLIESALSNLGL